MEGDGGKFGAGPAVPGWTRAVAWLGIVLHLLVGAFPYSITGLLVPVEGVVALWVVWALLLWLAFRLVRRRPVLVPAVPAVALVVWWTVVTLGDLLLGWTA